MPTEPIPFTRRKASAPSPVNEVHIIWITAGLGCDGDSVSVTAAEQPSLEDVVSRRDSRTSQSSFAQPSPGL